MLIHLLLVFLALLLVLLNAFFVAAEFGMVRLRHTQIYTLKNTYGSRGNILEEIHKHLDSYLSACQLGITLASLGLGWIGEPAFARLLEPLFVAMGVISPRLVTVISFSVAFIFISFLHIVVGELMPKSLAIRQSETISLWTAIPLYGFYWLMYPAIVLLNTCSNFLLRAVGLNAKHSSEYFYSSEELKLILNTSHVHGELSQEETDILEHTLDLAELKVTEVMQPRDNMIMLNLQDPIETVLQTVTQRRYSRYPVYDLEKKEIVGIIHVKDLFITLSKEKIIVSLKPLIRPVLKVQSHLPAMDLLRKFREGMPHFALVYKGQENLLGFVTLDNLLHVLLGRIKDEFHKTQDAWTSNADGSFSVKGECSIYSLETALDCDITLTPEEEEADTLAGLIIARTGTLPQVGDKIIFNEFDAVIENVEGSYIKKVTVYPKITPDNQ